MVSGVSIDTYLITEKNPNKKYYFIMEKKYFLKKHFFEKSKILRKKSENIDFKWKLQVIFFTWSFHLKSTFSDFSENFEFFKKLFFLENIFLHDEIIFFVRIFFCDQVCISTFDSAAQNRYMAARNAYMIIYSKISPPGLILKVVHSYTNKSL